MITKHTILVFMLGTALGLAVAIPACFFTPLFEFNVPSPFAAATTQQTKQPDGASLLERIMPDSPPTTITFDLRLDWTASSANPGHQTAAGTVTGSGSVALRAAPPNTNAP